MRGILVGLGGRAESWLQTCRERKDIDFAAFVEPAPGNQDRAVQKWGVQKDRIHPTLEDAISKAKADFVVDVTPPAVHEKVALTSFKAGLHVLGEKPLSDSFEAARGVVEAGKKAGLRHMITQNYRFGGLPRTSRRLLAQGIIGDPAQLDIAFYMAWADMDGSHYVTQPYMFLTDMGIHHFDMMRYVLGREAQSVQAISWNLPWGWHKGDASQVVLFTLDGGIKACHRAMGCSVGKKTTWNGDWRIEGPKGSLLWEGDKLLYVWDHRTDKPRQEEIPQDSQPFGGQRAILEEFLAAIQEKREPECGAADNLKSMAMVFAALKSVKEKREVSLKEL